MGSVETARRQRINLEIAIPYFGLYVGAVVGVWAVGISWKAVAVCAGSFFFRMVWIGIAYHRYFSHRAFKTSRAMQFVMAVLGVLGVSRGPLWWAWTHRAHHRHTDKPLDLHSPRHLGFFRAHWGWFLDPANDETDYDKIADFARYPELVAIDHARWYYIPIALYALGLYAIAGWTGVVYGLAVSTVILWNVTHWIQSLSHYAGGYRHFDSDDDSRNHFFLGLFSLGEWHHNHHHLPGSARQGFTWWEIDVNWWILLLMEKLGLIWDLRRPPAEVLREAAGAILPPRPLPPRTLLLPAPVAVPQANREAT
jgi:stearoyl-CoA desaturase (delta-9 desaturase)